MTKKSIKIAMFFLGLLISTSTFAIGTQKGGCAADVMKKEKKASQVMEAVIMCNDENVKKACTKLFTENEDVKLVVKVSKKKAEELCSYALKQHIGTGTMDEHLRGADIFITQAQKMRFACIAERRKGKTGFEGDWENDLTPSLQKRIKQQKTRNKEVKRDVGVKSIISRLVKVQ